MTIKLYEGDCRRVMAAMPDASVDSIVTDPPYELGFMGKGWDASGIAHDVGMWREALRVLKPGGHVVAFGGTRTYHRLAVAIEDAGFELRDSIGYAHEGESMVIPVREVPWLAAWVYGSGFPKSMDVSKAIDKAAGAEREVVGMGSGRTGKSAQPNGGSAFSDDGYQWPGQFNITAPATDAARQWEGWGTALKPAWEPIVLARKPLAKGMTVAGNVLAHGTGAINVDGCRVGETVETWPSSRSYQRADTGAQSKGTQPTGAAPSGRWPANLIHDGSDGVAGLFPREAGAAARVSGNEASAASTGNVTGQRARVPGAFHGDSGSAARFFYCAKAAKSERGPTNTHPTVKPLALMRYLLRMVTPPGGTALDMFAGSGSTLRAAQIEGFSAIGIELAGEHVQIIVDRCAGNDLLSSVEVIRNAA